MCFDLFGQKFRDEGRPRTRNGRVSIRRPCDSFSISASGSWGNLTSRRERVKPRLYYTRSDDGNKERFRWNGETLGVYIIGSRVGAQRAMM